MNNTLTVSGATATGPLTVTGNGSVSGTLSAGASTFPQITLTNAQPTIEFTAAGGHIQAASGAMQWSVGSHYNGSAWIADQTSAAVITLGTGGQTFYLDSGLTVGSSYGPTPTLSAGTSLLFDRDQNAYTLVQVENNNAGSGANAALRAWSGTTGGNHIVDVAMPSSAFSTGACCLFTADRAYLSSNAGNGLLIESSGAGATANLYLTAPNGNQVVIAYGSHLDFAMYGSTYKPTVTACGTGATMAPYSTDNAGYVQTGASGNCTVVFGAGWTVGTPACHCTAQAATWCSGVANGSSFAMTFGTALGAGTWVAYTCMGEQ
jgi:hypothetical protein